MEFTPDPEKCRRPPYGREPYIQIGMPDGSTRDGKAWAWQDRMVLARWFEGQQDHTEWMPAHRVHRIKRSESAWHESSDDLDWYLEQGEG